MNSFTEFLVQTSGYANAAADLLGMKDQDLATYDLVFHGKHACTDGSRHTASNSNCPHNTKPELGIHVLDTRYFPNFTIGRLMGPIVSVSCPLLLGKFSYLELDLTSDKDLDTAHLVLRTYDKSLGGTTEIQKRRSKLKLTANSYTDKESLRDAFGDLFKDGPGKDTPLGKLCTQKLHYSVASDLWGKVPSWYWGNLTNSQNGEAYKARMYDGTDFQ